MIRFANDHLTREFRRRAETVSAAARKADTAELRRVYAAEASAWAEAADMMEQGELR